MSADLGLEPQTRVLEAFAGNPRSTASLAYFDAARLTQRFAALHRAGTAMMTFNVHEVVADLCFLFQKPSLFRVSICGLET